MSENLTAYDKYIEKITNIFLDGIKNKNLSFQKKWKPSSLMEDVPHNPKSKKAYKGMNSLILDIVHEEKMYDNNTWLTYAQIKEFGGTVRKGEKGTPIAFFTRSKKEEIVNEKGEKETLETKLKRPVFKQYTVFNLNQTTLEKDQFKELYKDGFQIGKFNDIKNIENIKKNLDLELVHKNMDKAYYRPAEDKIFLPLKEQFKSEASYYSTFLHELGHATGHEKRLNRKELFDNYNISNESRAKEELRAEIYSYLQAKDLGIDLDLENHQSYVKSWANLLKEDKRELVNAIKDSFQMMKYVKENYIKDSLENQEQEKEITPPLKENLTKTETLKELENKINDFANQKIDEKDYLIQKESLVNNLLTFENDRELEKTFKELERRLNINQDEQGKYSNENRSYSYQNRINLYTELINKIDSADYQMIEEDLTPVDLSKDYSFATSISKAQATELYKKASKAIQHTENEMLYFKVEDKIVNVFAKNGIYTISNEKSYSDDIFDINNTFFSGKGKVLKDKKEAARESTKESFAGERKKYDNEYTKLPLDEILKYHGYDEVREKSSRNSKVVSNGTEKIVINRVKSGDYLYFTTDNTEKGNIYTFAKNRGTTVKELLLNQDINNLTKHNIAINSNTYNPAMLTKFENLGKYNISRMDYLGGQRQIKKDILKEFDNIKIDKFGNAVFPVYTVEGEEKKVLTVSGFSKKLLNPITKDKEGKPYQKPLKALDYGKTGISILIPNNTKAEEVNKLILGENSIDNLSYLQVKKLPSKNTALISFNGQITENALKAFEFFINKNNIKEVIKTFDNDKDGNKYDNMINESLKKIGKNDIKNIVDKSKLKDWNEDLKDNKFQAKKMALKMGYDLKNTKSQDKMRA